PMSSARRFSYSWSVIRAFSLSCFSCISRSSTDLEAMSGHSGARAGSIDVVQEGNFVKQRDPLTIPSEIVVDPAATKCLLLELGARRLRRKIHQARTIRCLR